MAQKVYVVDGRQFRTDSDYACAKHDKAIIDKIRGETDFGNRQELERLHRELYGGKYKFQTLLGQDFLEEVEELRKRAHAKAHGQEGAKPSGGSPDRAAVRTADRRPVNASRNRTSATAGDAPSGRTGGASGRGTDAEMEKIVALELKKRERIRKLTIALCSAAAALCLGYVGVYTYYNSRTESDYQELKQLKENSAPARTSSAPAQQEPLYTLDKEPEAREVLEEYKNLLIKNQKLIGWVKIDDTNIDFPVMQTTDNEYYLHHNIYQEYDKNGSIFMDKDCDVLKPSTNFILYGHHTKTGRMFGKLSLYESEDYYKEHRYIHFDTIYEKGTYEIMYVFRSKVYKEDEIVFKYYQFIDANGEQEFDSYMQEMAALSFYDTGVTAEYGDQLLTLSTCDYEQKDGRFVVVAKKIAEE